MCLSICSVLCAALEALDEEGAAAAAACDRNALFAQDGKEVRHACVTTFVSRMPRGLVHRKLLMQHLCSSPALSEAQSHAAGDRVRLSVPALFQDNLVQWLISRSTTLTSSARAHERAGLLRAGQDELAALERCAYERLEQSLSEAASMSRDEVTTSFFHLARPVRDIPHRSLTQRRYMRRAIMIAYVFKWVHLNLDARTFMARPSTAGQSSLLTVLAFDDMQQLAEFVERFEPTGMLESWLDRAVTAGQAKARRAIFEFASHAEDLARNGPIEGREDSDIARQQEEMDGLVSLRECLDATGVADAEVHLTGSVEWRARPAWVPITAAYAEEFKRNACKDFSMTAEDFALRVIYIMCYVAGDRSALGMLCPVTPVAFSALSEQVRKHVESEDGDEQ